MHSSSSLTLILKYFFPIIFVIPLFLTLLSTEQTTRELIFFAVQILVLSIIYIRTFGKLRKVRALHNQLVSDTISYEETIPYDKIIYVYQIALINPIMIGIQYIDEETGEQKKFFTLASWSNKLFTWNYFEMEEVELTKFIRKKAKLANPNYDEANEPSRWAPALYMVLTILVSFLLGYLILGI